MKTYIIWKENVHIGDVYSAIKKDWDWKDEKVVGYLEDFE